MEEDREMLLEERRRSCKSGEKQRVRIRTATSWSTAEFTGFTIITISNIQQTAFPQLYNKNIVNFTNSYDGKSNELLEDKPSFE